MIKGTEMACTLKDSFKVLWNMPSTNRKRTENFYVLCPLFLPKHCFCVHRSDFILSICLVPSARYICLGANSIYFRFAQTRYDINPRSRSEHIECVSTYRTRKRISKIRKSGFISMRSVLANTAPNPCLFVFKTA